MKSYLKLFFRTPSTCHIISALLLAIAQFSHASNFEKYQRYDNYSPLKYNMKRITVPKNVNTIFNKSEKGFENSPFFIFEPTLSKSNMYRLRNAYWIRDTRLST